MCIFCSVTLNSDPKKGWTKYPFTVNAVVPSSFKSTHTHTPPHTQCLPSVTPTPNYGVTECTGVHETPVEKQAQMNEC